MKTRADVFSEPKSNTTLIVFVQGLIRNVKQSVIGQKIKFAKTVMSQPTTIAKSLMMVSEIVLSLLLYFSLQDIQENYIPFITNWRHPVLKVTALDIYT